MLFLCFYVSYQKWNYDYKNVTVQSSAELLLHPPMISRLRRGADACCHHVFSRFAQ
ncbi:hypothetical protein HMPREF1548_02019 [Clostridium sp. KLE 1755]|nr:hypothetical protein HMPREF1548_02019 [Clostridium sp. KLE 1755]